ncbi:MAG: mechanosensitive ion channel [Lentimicrobium sp.]|nr:mechanosensitive ion channel [Lentimicrobium sp.]MDD2528048.1 mechanosensitive ion channel [Lentimicrobiaceae bacterium]MDD4597677.1 mechanosensitive ion channel [Lentimicrobiaceae bacterium]MDY0025563.1 mechanosensitive ion channel [Lentimicrobium sp.]
MRTLICVLAFIFQGMVILAQEPIDSATMQLREFQSQLAQSEQLRKQDSVRKAELLEKISLLQANRQMERNELLKEFRKIEQQDSLRQQEQLKRIAQLKISATGYPVVFYTDTLFYIYNRIGAMKPAERAQNISKKIRILYDDDFMDADSIVIINSGNTVDVVYKDMILMSISELDALWYDKTQTELANSYKDRIKSAIAERRAEYSIWKILGRIGLVLLVLISILGIIYGIGRLHQLVSNYVISKKEVWLRDLSFKDYVFLTVEQELTLFNFLLKVARWFFILLALYLVLPVIFSIFPFTRGWADSLFALIWKPFKGVLLAIWNFLPNLFSIFVIVFVMRYVVKFIRYLFSEIEAGKLNIGGFHADWAKPTMNIIRVLLYAFTFVLIFPYLPGSNSSVFQGVSVFLGLLVSLGSSSAISNMVAGLVITYMRPFKIGDRITLGAVTGDVVEKTLLVTRLRTVKNEEITIPNAAVLSGNTVNYTVNAQKEGLIIYTTVTIGYDVPWTEMHKCLLEAANRTGGLVKTPRPFVLQTSLEDFYVSYQINAYTHDAAHTALIYSELHQHIQDVCNERGIEIMSPHYRASRDGNQTTIPESYLPPEYEKPGFNIHLQQTGDSLLQDDHKEK